MRATRWRGSVRLRLATLYSAVFLLAGIVLLSITYVLVAHRTKSSTFYATSSSGTVSTGDPTLGPQHIVINQGAPPAGVPDPLNGQVLIQQVRAASERQRLDSLHQLLVDSALALGVMAVASVGLGWLVAGRALRPLRDMTSAARVISEHNLHERLPDQGPQDELGDLARTVNALLGRLEAAFESQRQFVANASHELRTPLTLERALLEVALADPDANAETLRVACERVLAIGASQEALIEALLTLARSQRGVDERVPLDLATVVADAPAIDAGPVGVAFDLAPAATSGDPRLVERLVTNLIDNGVRHNFPGGRVEVSTAVVNGRPTLRVENTGPQVAPDQIDRLLQPFERARRDRGTGADGLGLGLSIVAAIAVAHGAVLTARARPEGGLAVAVAFAP